MTRVHGLLGSSHKPLRNGDGGHGRSVVWAEIGMTAGLLWELKVLSGFMYLLLERRSGELIFSAVPGSKNTLSRSLEAPL